jgi:hypothetical protein
MVSARQLEDETSRNVIEPSQYAGGVAVSERSRKPTPVVLCIFSVSMPQRSSKYF